MYLERGRDLLEVRRRVLAAAEIREAPDGVPGHGHAAGLGEHRQQRRENALEWHTVVTSQSLSDVLCRVSSTGRLPSLFPRF